MASPGPPDEPEPPVRCRPGNVSEQDVNRVALAATPCGTDCGNHGPGKAENHREHAEYHGEYRERRGPGRRDAPA